MSQQCQNLPPVFSPKELDGLVARIDRSYADRVGVNLHEDHNLPRREEVLDIVSRLLELVFPGFDGRQRRRDTLGTETAEMLQELRGVLSDQISRAVRYSCQDSDCEECDVAERSRVAVRTLLLSLPDIRETMKLDVAAAYTGDPAATSAAEIVLSYPCIKAITIQRLAHVLYLLKIPLIPRMMTEYAHTQTGIDIHPGAKLGQGIFIDHGTGVVIGETAEIGDNVRIYQGVTLGALSFPKDACGALVKGVKRHPVVRDNVIIYAGATVLGNIEIGEKCVIGGNVWLTESLPPGTKITARPPEHRVRFCRKNDR